MNRKTLLTRVIWIVILAGLITALCLCFSAPGHEAPSPRATEAMPLPAATPVPGPLAGLTILVDPGHGGYDGGARCRDSGLWEKQVNLAVAQRVEALLADRGARVLMTRTADVDLCAADRPATMTKKREDMQRRVAMAEEGGADLLLSIHMNEYRDRAESGPQVFYRAGCDGGRLLAACVQDALIRGLAPRKQRVCMAGDYYILRLSIPSVLIECGFISNPAEEKLLLTADYQQSLACAIVSGVEEYARLSSAGNEAEAP